MTERALSADARPVPTLGWRDYTTTILALVRRDIRVQVREFPAFTARTVMQPFLFVFVFAYVFPKIGQDFQSAGTDVSFATLLVPGLIGVTIVFQGVTSVALPLAIEFGATREIEDRALSPVPVWVIGVEKIVFGAVQSILAGLLVFPFIYTIPSTPVDVQISNWPLMITVLVLGSLVSGSLGLVLGTIVKPMNIGLMFSITVLPLTFLGAVYYPWEALGAIRWLQILVLLNPVVYINEGLRSVMTPDVPHMDALAFLSATLVTLALLTYFGLRGFVRQTVG